MDKFSFPIFKTKTAGVTQRFLLEDPVERRKYFDAKAGNEIEKIREFLEKNTFVGFMLGPKNSGKGTYVKLFMEAIGSERIAHVSVGDIVRSINKDLENAEKKEDLVAFLRRRYRGFITIEQALDVILGRDTKTLLPTEIILSLVERAMDRIGRKAVFIDGFPRNPDQISYSLYFRALMGYRDDPDFFVFIDAPEAVIDERMKYRVVCPECQTPRNLKLLRTKNIGYDTQEKSFYLLCDNPLCSGYGRSRMVAKEGDMLGIEAVRDRIEVDRQVIKSLLGLQGVPKIYLRNSVPKAVANDYIDDYEITPSYRFEWDTIEKKTRVIEEPWLITDDEGVSSYSLLPVPIALALIKQVASVLGL